MKFFSPHYRDQGPPLPRKKRKKNKGRRKAGLAGNNLFKNKEATHRENKIMLKKLERERGRKNKLSESDKNQALAKLAGIDIPSTSDPPAPKKGKQKSRGEKIRKIDV